MVLELSKKLNHKRKVTMINKLIEALAEVLDVDLNELQGMSKLEMLEHLEKLQMEELRLV